jgi:hypothetical protein
VIFGILLCDFVPKEGENLYLLCCSGLDTVLDISHTISFNSKEKWNGSDEHSLLRQAAGFK